jgi:hypothetical protein
MRQFLIAAVLLSCTAAAGEDLNTRAHPLLLPLDTQKTQHFAGPSAAASSPRELLGDTLGNWLGVRAGRWDVFSETLSDDNSSGNGPVLAGTVRKDAAEIQLRWRSDE